jgi:nucleoside-diphosphate-sugar epimerase
MKILITGAAGNMGSLTARSLIARGHRLRLLVHRTPLPQDLSRAPQVEVVHADLERPDSLAPAVQGVDAVIHYAGVLFRPRPERFLPRTNLGYVVHLVQAALEARVRKIALVSFPQVEGPTSPAYPASGRLDGRPTSVHARTRLAAELHLLEACRGTDTIPVVLRAGLVYARGMILIEAARWLMRRGLFGVWPGETWYHPIALPDYLTCAARALEMEAASGIYLIADDRPLLLREMADRLARHWGYPRPRRLPRAAFFAAALACESFALAFGTAAPLSRDVIRIGMISHACDTSRMKAELLPKLEYPTFEQGLTIL